MNLIDNQTFLCLAISKLGRFLFPFILVLSFTLSSQLCTEVVEAQATTTTTREELAVDATIQGCNEMIAFSGIAKIVTHSTVDASGGIHMSRHLIFQHVLGTGLVSNARYRIINSSQTNSYIGGPFPVVVTGPFNLRVVSAGPGNNFMLSGFDRVTVNANGTVTSFVEHFRSECQ
jgi:hypothetical protein